MNILKLAFKVSRGILVASDEHAEWLLPWWWERYQKCNRLPVCFVDLGLSHFGRTFCEKKGQLITLDSDLPCSSKEELSLEKIACWEGIYGKTLWRARPAWFKKPHALLKTPFEKTLWLDLDCEVLVPLDSLFDQHGGDSFVIAPEAEGNEYNSGVILYSRECPLLKDWQEATHTRSSESLGDQQLLSQLIQESAFEVSLLDERYNWRMARGVNIDAAIIHWVGAWGKEYIRKHGFSVDGAS